MRRVIGNENGGATEVDTAVSIEGTGAIRASDTVEDMDARTRRQVAAFHMRTFLDDLVAYFRLARYRRAQGTELADEPPVPVGICSTCRTMPAAYHGSCFGCLRKRGVPSL